MISLQEIFAFDHTAGVDDDGRHRGTIEPTGIRPMFADRLRDEGLDIPARLLGIADPVRELRRR